MTAFETNPLESTKTLRRVAARNLGIEEQMPSGTSEEYLNLDAATQIRLTDEMARIIVTYPAGWPQSVIDLAKGRVNGGYYNKPLDNPSVWANLDQGIMPALWGGMNYAFLLGIVAVGVIAFMWADKSNFGGKKK